MTATAGILRGVAKGGNVAMAVSPAGTRARVAAGASLGEAPPPTDPGGVLPKNGLICINIVFIPSSSSKLKNKFLDYYLVQLIKVR